MLSWKISEGVREGDRARSTEWFERDFKEMTEAEFVAYFKLIILERKNK